LFSSGTGNSTWSTCGVFSSWSWLPFPFPLAFLGGRPRPRPFPPRPLPAAGAGSGVIFTTRTGPGAYFSHLGKCWQWPHEDSAAKKQKGILVEKSGSIKPIQDVTCKWLTTMVEGEP
jgi:hypothetical protein